MQTTIIHTGLLYQYIYIIKPDLIYLYEDNDEPLTPSHLVLGRRVLTPAKSARSDISDEVDTVERATRRERHLKTVLTHFWKRWKQEYLTQLREYHRPREAKGPSVNKGDVVVIAEDNVKRLNWNMNKYLCRYPFFKLVFERCSLQNCK